MLENCKIVKPNNRTLHLWLTYNRYYGRTLSDCYKKPSQTKKNIYNYWCEIAKRYDTTPTVLTYNGFIFSLGFVAENHFIIITVGQNLAVPLDKLPKN